MSAFLYENGELITVSKSNPLPVSTPDGLTVSGTATSAAVLFTTSMLNYESITVQVTSAGTGCTITYETSCDSVTWLPCGGVPSTNLGASGAASTSTTVGQTQFSRRGLYFRARVSTYGSGTVSIIAVLSKTPFVQLGCCACKKFSDVFELNPFRLKTTG